MIPLEISLRNVETYSNNITGKELLHVLNVIDLCNKKKGSIFLTGGAEDLIFLTNKM